MTDLDARERERLHAHLDYMSEVAERWRKIAFRQMIVIVVLSIVIILTCLSRL